MSFEAFTTDRLRSAEQQEIIDGESGMIADLVDVLSAKHIHEGVLLRFGNDRASFKRALEVLALQESIKTGKLHVHDMCVGSNYSQSHCSGTLGEWAKSSTNLAATLDYMQAARWKSLPGAYEGHVGPIGADGPQIGSSISMVHIGFNEEGVEIVDMTQPMITVEADYRYEPEIFDNENYDMFDLRDFAAKHPEGISLPKQLTKKLSDELYLDDETLALPEGRYSLSMGQISRFKSTVFDPLKIAETQHIYRLQAGRFVEDVYKEDGEY